jgi:hypothetical protein
VPMTKARGENEARSKKNRGGFGMSLSVSASQRALKNLPVALSLLRGHDLAIVAEDHVWVDVDHIDGQPRRVLVFGMVIGGETVSHTAAGMSFDPGTGPNALNVAGLRLILAGG